MTQYIVRRLLWMVVVLFGISFVTFTMQYLIPGDVASSLAGPAADLDVIEQIRHEMGLDQPLYVQYGRYLWQLAHGNLGRSWFLNQGVTHLIVLRLPATAKLALTAAFLELALGLTVGFISAVKQYSLTDRLFTLFAMFGISAPAFWVGLLLLYFLAFKLPIFPLGGYGGLRHVFLPALTVAISGTAWYGRVFRSALLDVLSADYVRTARAKGLRERMVMLRHALPNAIKPVVTMIGMDLSGMLGGLVIIESIFAWPGIGRQTFTALLQEDTPLVMGTIAFTGFILVFMNLVVDIAYAIIDPRIRYE